MQDFRSIVYLKFVAEQQVRSVLLEFLFLTKLADIKDIFPDCGQIFFCEGKVLFFPRREGNAAFCPHKLVIWPRHFMSRHLVVTLICFLFHQFIIRFSYLVMFHTHGNKINKNKKYGMEKDKKYLLIETYLTKYDSIFLHHWKVYLKSMIINIYNIL